MVNKTPKLNRSDRYKIIDRPEILIVHPLTVQASIRYGHKAAWCTSKISDNRFMQYKRKGLLIYVLIYDVVDNKRMGDAKTKIALYRK
jgi:hypothetical protein